MLIQDITPPVKRVIKPVGKIIKKQARNKYVSAFLAFVLVFQTITGVFAPFNISLRSPGISPQEARAVGENWFNTGGTWNYRRQITLDPVTPAANYQVQVQLTAANFNYSQMSFPDTGADLRFTASNGSTLQDYWIETWVNGGTSTIWVEVTTSGESSIYMYYGNNAATAGTDGANTFIFFDDFPGASVDGTKWATGGSPAVGSGILTLNTGAAWEWVEGKTYTSQPIITEARMSFPATGSGVRGSYALITSGDTDYVMFDTQTTTQKVRGNYTGDTSYVSSWTTGSYRKFKITLTNTATSFYDEGSQVSNSPITDSTLIPVANTAPYFDAYNSTLLVDWVYVRKYTATEPAATVQNEETPNTAPTATAPTASQATDGTGYVTIQTTIDDADNDDTVRVKVEYSLDGGSTWTSGDPYLTSYITTSPDQATEPDVTNAQEYQVGMPTNNIITSAGANTVTIKWDTKSASNGTGAITSESNVKLRITPHDGTSAGTPVVSDAAFAIDNSAPSGTIQINSNDAYTTSSAVTLNLSATGATEVKFSLNNSDYTDYVAYEATKAGDLTNPAFGGTSSDGTKTVYAIFKDAYGNEAAAVNDNIVYDTTPPTNPTAAVDAQGAVTDTWQNNKNDPNFTSFTGESDPLAPDSSNSGVGSFYVYFGTDSVGVTTDSIVTDAYNPASFATSSTRYLRVITKDNAGNWADPDGAGTTCTNTNASRPADADCWATIFIHKYDIDAPNTPSPASIPVSWTNANSFDFSWSDPGDVGGSGTKDYTYQTDAGTGATTTASTSVNGLTSNADGTKLFFVKANDNAGNSGTDGTVNFYYDNTPPANAGAATDGNGSLDDTWGTVSDPNFTWGAGTDAGDQSGVKEYDVYWGTDSGGTTVTATVLTNAYNPAAISVNTPYYLRIRTRDNALNESAWATKFTMKFSQAASTPTNAVQTANGSSLTFGAWTSDTTPTVGFTLADPDDDTVGYIGKIDNNSDFSSPEVFYTYTANDLPSGGDYTFAVGQAAGTGTYTNGSEGQTLAEGQYYWKGQAIESHGLASSEAIANGGLVAFGVDTSNPTGTTLGFGTIATDSITATVSGAADAVSGLNTAPYYFENTTAATNSGWQAGTSWSSGTLTANTQYTLKVTSKDKAGNTQATATQNKYTLANDPTAPTVNNAAATTLDVNVNVNSNPAGTEFAIYKETGATCDGSGGSYIAADGSDNGATAVWQTDAVWGTATATGLAESTQYSFCVKARNGDNTETSFGFAASGTTNAANVAPNAPALVSPANASFTSDTTPTLSANYSDPDSGDIGTTNYRIATSAGNCLSGTVVDSGTSSATSDENEDTAWTPASSIGSDGTYYWCAQNNDSALTSSWTAMGNFILDTAAPTGTTLGFGTIAVDSITATVSGAADSGAGLHATPYYFENTTAATNSGWQAGTSWASGSLTPNTQYTFKVKSKDTLGSESSFTATQSKYALANIPSSLNLIADSGTQITASWNANSNPDGTEYYAENTTAGTNSGWVMATSWVSSGLTCGTSYSFKVKAKNTDGTETTFTDAISESTSACPSAGGGGGLPSGAYSPPSQPPATSESPAGFRVLINNGDTYTASREVTLTLNGGPDAKNMAISQSPGFQYASLEPYQTVKSLVLAAGDGIKTVYVKYYTQWGQSSEAVSGSIILDSISPAMEISGLKDFYYSNENVILSGLTEPSSAVYVRLDGGSSDNIFPYADSSGKWSHDFGKMSSGIHKLELWAKDASGNVGDSAVANLNVKSPSVPAPAKPVAPSPAPKQTSTSIPPISSPPKAPPLDIPKKQEPEKIEPVPAPVPVEEKPKAPERPSEPENPSVSKESSEKKSSEEPSKLPEPVKRDLSEPAKNMINSVKTGMSSQYKSAAAAAGNASGFLYNVAQNLYNSLAQSIGRLGRYASSATTTAKDSVAKNANNLQGGLAGLFRDVKVVLAAAGSQVQDTITGIKVAIFESSAPMEISNVKAVTLSSTSVRIEWETNHKGTSKVNWGLTRVYDQEKQDSSKVTRHSVVLTDLQPGTVYHYEVISQNGSYAYDADRIFYTPEE